MFNLKYINYQRKVNEKGLNIEFPLPGYSKEDVSVKQLNDSINITATKEEDKKTYSVPIQEYWESIDYDFQKIKAKMLNGLLKIEIPLKEEKNQEIPIT